MNTIQIFCPNTDCPHSFVFKFSKWNIPLLWTAYHQFRSEYISHMKECRKEILVREGLNEAGKYYMGAI